MGRSNKSGVYAVLCALCVCMYDQSRNTLHSYSRHFCLVMVLSKMVRVRVINELNKVARNKSGVNAVLDVRSGSANQGAGGRLALVLSCTLAAPPQ